MGLAHIQYTPSKCKRFVNGQTHTIREGMHVVSLTNLLNGSSKINAVKLIKIDIELDGTYYA
jgi:hypothetical protein